jgi:hypothetical protein
MGTCEVCGNSYDKAFSVTLAGDRAHTFDSFECAIQKTGGTIFCCEHCAHA